MLTNPSKTAFGDFQTPLNLAREVCALVAQSGFDPASILEPTCGIGAFLQAALETFPHVRRILGLEINPHYVSKAQEVCLSIASQTRVEIHQADFFLTDWPAIMATLPEPILVIGNPPWVTNSALSALGSANTPVKANLDNLRGIDALTGKSNFDISEWMLRKNLEWLDGKHGMLAVLCKTAVARKVLAYAWQHRMRIASASLYRFDSRAHFGVAVDACLLLIHSHPAGNSQQCAVFSTLQAHYPASVFGWQDGVMVADLSLYQKWRSLFGTGLKGWRSGIKHDSSPLFELRIEHGKLINGLGEVVDLEPDVLFPLLKTSDLAAHRQPRLWMVVPQRTMSDDPIRLQIDAPKTWHYLNKHAHLLAKRKSSIYKNRPRFAIFGVGSYSFAPWKIAISGLYKKLEFVKVPPYQGRPVVFDDTCYFFPCESEAECDLLYELVMSDPAQEFWSALIFWDAKRPITAQSLNSLNLLALAHILGKTNDTARALAERQVVEYTVGTYQRPLL